MIWLSADATTFAVPCEACRDDRSWSEWTEPSVIEGTLRPEADVGFTTCCRGHRVRVRRIARLRVAAAH